MCIVFFFYFCYERDFITSLSGYNQADIIEAFNSTFRCLDEPLNIGNPYFEGMVNQIYPPKLQLNKANTSDTCYIYLFPTVLFPPKDDKHDNFDFDIFGIDVPRLPSYGVFISQLIRFARVCGHVDDFNARSKYLTSKILKQDYRFHKLIKAFSKFYRRHNKLVSKFNVGLKSYIKAYL